MLKSSVCKEGRDVLQGSFCVGDKSSIICEEEVPHQPSLGLGVGLKAPLVE